MSDVENNQQIPIFDSELDLFEDHKATRGQCQGKPIDSGAFDSEHTRYHCYTGRCGYWGWVRRPKQEVKA